RSDSSPIGSWPTTPPPASATSSSWPTPAGSTRSSPPARPGWPRSRRPRWPRSARRWASDEASRRVMGFELTPRERRWFDAVLVLAAVTLGFIVLGYIGQVFGTFADLILVFFLAWLLAFILSPLVTRLRTAVPILSRAGAVLVVYIVLFGLIVIVSVLVASALVGSIGQLIASLP